MNKDQAQGKFEQLKGKLKAAWGNLTDNEIALYDGRQEEFFGKLQEKYGIARNEAEKKVKDMEASLKRPANAA